LSGQPLADQGKEEQMQHQETRQDQFGLRLEMFRSTGPSGANLSGCIFDGIGVRTGGVVSRRDNTVISSSLGRQPVALKPEYRRRA
jgi:hypothetical protein